MHGKVRETTTNSCRLESTLTCLIGEFLKQLFSFPQNSTSKYMRRILACASKVGYSLHSTLAFALKRLIVNLLLSFLAIFSQDCYPPKSFYVYLSLLYHPISKHYHTADGISYVEKKHVPCPSRQKCVRLRHAGITSASPRSFLPKS
jgi:hypothetical protein